ncbi:MAG: PLDc N-terminal domain-containing protein [Candidatus Methanoperedens sp.]|nr:PLDc N-terminal domain-containing protein [Candidatus Methanoperedens sp.]
MALVFWLWMLIDCLKRLDDKFATGGNNAKLIWVLVIIFTGLIGALIYYFLIKKADTQNDKLIVIALLALVIIVIILIAGLFTVNTVSTISIEPHTSSKLIESTPYETAVSSLVNQTPSSHSVAPAISAIQPNSGTIGTKVVITGTGFTPGDNNVAFRLEPEDSNETFKVGYINNLISRDGKTIEFELPKLLGACSFPLPETTPVTVCPDVGLNFKPNQTYPVFVVNKNGTSNSVNFIVYG